MKVLCALIGGIILMIPLSIYRAYWLTVLWSLSAVQYYSASSMTIPQAATVTFLFTFLMYGVKREDELNNNYTEYFINGLVKGLVIPPIAVGSFWLVSKFF